MRLPPEQARTPRASSRRARRIWIIAFVVFVIICLLSVQGVANFYTDYLWYRSEHITFVWRAIVETKLSLAAVFVAVMFLAVWLSLWFVDRMAPRALLFAPELDLVRRYQAIVGPHVVLVRTLVAAVIAFAVGEGAASQWQNWLLFQHAQNFGITDPIFGRDAGFFVFRLPFLSFLVSWMVVALIVVFFITAISHYLNGSIRLQGAGPRVDPIAIAHLSLILGLIALVKAIGYYYVGRYMLEFSSRGVVEGANYTDVHVELPAITLLAVVALFAFAMLAYNVYQRSLILPVIGIGLWAMIGISIGLIYPALVQAVKVTPSQSTIELPYISDNIKMTQYAFGINDIGQKTYGSASSSTSSSTASSTSSTLTPAQAGEYAQTLNDAVLWDPNQTTTTFQKLQSQRSYFQLSGLAVDRYTVAGKEPTPYVIGVRTLDTAGVPSPSWVNTHLQYTHGYGLAMSPANSATSAGNPNFVVSNIPVTTSSSSLSIEQPAVYFGDQPNGYVVVDTNQPEIDYTPTNSSAAKTSSYSGSGGVPIGSFWTKVAFALRLHNLNLVLSKLITQKSQIIFVPNVRQMVQKAAPFLAVDSNPYPVYSGGNIYWIVDAYTETSYFPYSEDADTSALSSSSGLQGTYNYLRNSVKVVVNAYTGQMQFYMMPGTDPLLNAYAAAFPGLFRPFSQMPDDLKTHLRYPQDFLELQATMYGRWHLSSASAFYNEANAWLVGQSPGTGSPSNPVQIGSTGRFQPVYEELQLAGGNSEPAFDLVEPMVPFSNGNRLQTLSGFIVASCDDGSYGELTMYTTPQGGPGPALIDSEINSNTAVSTSITLLDQHGSVVTTGAVQMLPVAGALVYIQPIYASSSQNPFPQLRYVVAVYGNDVALGKTLSLALAGLFNAPVPGVGVGQGGQPLGPTPGKVKEDVEEADHYEALAAEALKAGNLGAYQTDEQQVAIWVASADALLLPKKSTPGSSKSASAASKPGSDSTSTASSKSGSSGGGTGSGSTGSGSTTTTVATAGSGSGNGSGTGSGTTTTTPGTPPDSGGTGSADGSTSSTSDAPSSAAGHSGGH